MSKDNKSSSFFGGLARRLSRRGPTNPSSSYDPPPAYSAAPSAFSATATATTIPEPIEDDQFDFLSSFDTVFLIDDSGSMIGANWAETEDAIKTIAPICTERDSNGIDIYFLNNPTIMKNIVTSQEVVEAFQTVQPSGATPTGQRLYHILKEYLDQLEKNMKQNTLDQIKPLNIIVITDGQATDDVESPIIAAAKRLDQLNTPTWQVGIQFFQVGRNEHARKYLKHLDDEIKSTAGIRDIVDTVPFTNAAGSGLTGTGILKCVLGSVNKRHDRNSEDLHWKR